MRTKLKPTRHLNAVCLRVDASSMMSSSLDHWRKTVLSEITRSCGRAFHLFRLTANPFASKLPSSAGREDGGCLEGVGFAEELDYGGEGEAHYVEEVAFDARDPASGVALDAVGAGFVEGVVGGEVVGEVGVGDGGEEDAGGFYVGAVGGGRD